MLFIAKILKQAFIQQTAPAAIETNTPNLLWALFILLVLVVVAMIVIWQQWKATKKEYAQAKETNSVLKQRVQQMGEKEKQQNKKLEEKNAEIKKLKHNLASHKKKNYAFQDEIKTMRKDLESQIEQLDKAKSARPAFTEPHPSPEVETKKDSEIPKKPVEVTSEKTPAPTKKIFVYSESDMANKISRLEAENRSYQEQKQQDRTALRSSRKELGHLRKKVESLRRIDMISSGKQKILEEKINVLGKQYYDAISEIAQLKGEVQPILPKDAHPKSPTSTNSPEALDAGSEKEKPKRRPRRRPGRKNKVTQSNESSAENKNSIPAEPTDAKEHTDNGLGTKDKNHAQVTVDEKDIGQEITQPVIANPPNDEQLPGSEKVLPEKEPSPASEQSPTTSSN